MSTVNTKAQVQILSNTVWINYQGIELGLPKEVIMQAHAALVKKDGSDDGTGLGYMQPQNCPSCGLVPTSTGTCGYCGSKCE